MIQRWRSLNGDWDFTGGIAFSIEGDKVEVVILKLGLE